MHLDMCYVYMHRKSYVPRKTKMPYNLKRREYIIYILNGTIQNHAGCLTPFSIV